MLQGDFFNIRNLETAGFDIKADLVINAAHKIFEGHFPGHPVVPGVCMMQMVKEIMEQVFKKKTNLVSASDMKFLNIINPEENTDIQAALKYKIEENRNMTVWASLFKDDRIYFKFKGVFGLQEPQS